MRRFLGRLRSSVWAPLAAKAATVFAGMLALAAIGSMSTLQGSGKPLPDPADHAESAKIAGVFVPALARASGSASSHPRAAPPAGAGSSESHGAKPDGETSPDKRGAANEEPAAPNAAPAGVTPDGKVILNVASAEELRALPGIGKARAEAIVALRTRLGRFRRPTDLLRVRGIGPKSLQKMLPHLVLDPPAPPASSAESERPPP